MSEFKKGDIVQLKSGGPPMTVVSTADGLVSCQWFDKSRKINYGGFVPEALQEMKPRRPISATVA